MSSDRYVSLGATGLGPMPGTSALEASAVVVGECGLPFLPALPARGVGADSVGRSGAMLTDLALDTVPSGYRLVSRPGAVAKRAASFLGEDLDAFEEAWELSGRGRDGQLKSSKVNALGPLSLAAQVELASGHRVLTDLGATRDLAQSLADGLGELVRTLRRRCALDDVVVQLDEPLLGAVLTGSLPTLSGFATLPALDRKVALELLRPFSELGAAPVVRVHGTDCRELEQLVLDLPTSGPGFAVSVDARDLPPDAYDALAWFLQEGQDVLLGVAPGVRPADPVSVAALARKVGELLRVLGFEPAAVADHVWISPAEGLENADAGWPAHAFRIARDVVDALADMR